MLKSAPKHGTDFKRFDHQLKLTTLIPLDFEVTVQS